MDYGHLIFENYENYINENSEEFATPQDAVAMLTSDGAFRSYMTALTEGLTPMARDTVMEVAQRQREMLLEESIQLGPSASVIGYAVAYFPILTDIYAEPLLSEVCTPYTTQTSIVTVPKIEITGSVLNSDGTTTTYSLPRPTQLVRGATETINLAPNANNNLFSMSAGGIVTSETTRINRRYFVIDLLEVVDDSTGSDTTSTILVFIRPDARGQIEKEFTFQDASSNDVTGKLIGNINWDSGVVTYAVTFEGAAGVTYSVNYAQSKVMFSPTTGDIGRVKVKLKVSGWDIDVDEKDSFEISLTSETIQDYRDIYNVDLVRTMAEAIKRQILLNKDFDIAYFLNLSETEMATAGSHQVVDLDQFAVGAGDYRPANVLDIFKGVIPYINTVTRNVERNFRAAPQYLVAGLKTASLLDSLQEYVVQNQTLQRGEIGVPTKQMNFRKQTIIPCHAVPEDRIYLVFRAPNSDKSRSAILDVVYKPLYIVDEITNSIKRTFVKSRTAVEVVAPLSMGYIEVQNMPSYLG